MLRTETWQEKSVINSIMFANGFLLQSLVTRQLTGSVCRKINCEKSVIIMRRLLLVYCHMSEKELKMLQ
jgi:hypothetical protein